MGPEKVTNGPGSFAGIPGHEARFGAWRSGIETPVSSFPHPFPEVLEAPPVRLGLGFCFRAWGGGGRAGEEGIHHPRSQLGEKVQGQTGRRLSSEAPLDAQPGTCRLLLSGDEPRCGRWGPPHLKNTMGTLPRVHLK